MRCPVCSSEIPDGSWFCTECGAAMPEAPIPAKPTPAPVQEAVPEPPAKKKSYKLVAIIAAAAVIVILAVVILALVLAGKGGKKTAAMSGA